MIAAVAVLVGCGSSALGKSTYISRGDAICKSTGAAVGKVKAPPKGDLAATARYLRTSADLIDAELAKLRKLGKPKGDGQRLGDLLSRESDAISVLRRAANAAAAGERSDADALFTQAQGQLSDVGAGLRDYGFTVCGT